MSRRKGCESLEDAEETHKQMATITFDDSGVAENGQYVPEDGQSEGDEGKLPDVSYSWLSF